MRTILQFSAVRRSCRALVFSATLLCLPLLFAQKASSPSEPKYDLQNEVKLKGTVEEIKSPDNAKENIHLMLKGADESVEISLCPKSFLTDMGTSFAKGDEISLTGSKVKQENTNLVLARQVVKGNDTLLLRDEKGSPVWNWKH